ncbi:uncharacterized protein LOC121367428 isoform X2 [Gigantopelta aegis]|uniref:uncharacterized protein LOC121367428 isoform X2 n=1 Tax=Gigantopelta aegis TaxID=1735272 RepID=UPI001B88E360|nr:uncharacterized protein LOC121367428 isoform X2 [Gigantopelta aegis]
MCDSVQLKQLILVLMKAVSDKEIGTTTSHPCWWPPDIPWVPTLSQTAKGFSITDNMKAVVRSYYRHLGQENMLSCGKVTNWRLSLAKLQALQSRQVEQLHGARTGNSGKNNAGHIPFVGIYICFFCSEEFVNKDDMRKHQLTCALKPENLQSVESPEKTPRQSPVKSPGLHIFIPQMTVSVHQFMQKLYLVPLAKAKKLRESCRKSTEVNTIDFSDPQIPVSPSTPKTPKLLISQDSSFSKRRLSLSFQSHKENISDTESTASSENEEHEGKRRIRKSTSLFSIPVTSELGGRVLKHMVSETSMPQVLTNAEEFCKTPKKSKFADRLRVRENAFPINYKPRKRYKFHHSYKFSKAQRDEFLKTVNTGLDRNSRKLMSSLPKCSVRLVPLTRRQIRKYIRKSKKKSDKSVDSLNPIVSIRRLNESYFFPRKPILLSENIDRMLGLRKKRKNEAAKLSPMNVVSENTNVDLLKQKVVVYRSLLTDLSLSTAKQRLQFSKKSERRMKQKSVTVERDSASQLIAYKYLQAKKSLHSAEKKNCGTVSVKSNFPHLTELLEKKPISSCALSPSSINSSPESAKCLDRPLNIDIPSPESSLTHFLLSCDHDKQLREHLSPDRISIMTVSSDDCSLHEQCCMGCQLKKQCRCTTNQVSDKDDKGNESGNGTPCKNNLQSMKTLPCENVLELPKKTEQTKSSVPNGVHLSVGNKVQTRSSSLISSSVAMKRQTSAPAASNIYSLRSNLTSKVLVDWSNEQDGVKRFKSSKHQLPSVTLSSPRLVESCEEVLQPSLPAELPDLIDDIGVKNKTLRSNSSSVSLTSPRHLPTSDSPSKILARPSTRKSPTNTVHQSTSSDLSSTSATLKPSRFKDPSMHMTTRSNSGKEVLESDCQKTKSQVSDKSLYPVVRSLKFASPAEDQDEKESVDSVDDVFVKGDQYTRVDADILLKNVQCVSPLCKQKPVSVHVESQAVKSSARLHVPAGTWTRSKSDNSDAAFKKRKLDL